MYGVRYVESIEKEARQQKKTKNGLRVPLHLVGRSQNADMKERTFCCARTFDWPLLLSRGGIVNTS